MKKNLIALLFVVASLRADNNDDARRSFDTSSKQNPLSEQVAKFVDKTTEQLGGFFEKFRLPAQPSVAQQNNPVEKTDSVNLTKSVPSNNGTDVLNKQAAEKDSVVDTLKRECKKVRELISVDNMNKLKKYAQEHKQEIFVGVAAVVVIGTTLYIVYETGALKKVSTWINEHPKSVATLVLAAAICVALNYAYTHNSYDAQVKIDAAVAQCMKLYTTLRAKAVKA